MDRLKDKVAIVTGAGSVGPGWGNGRAIAARFAEEGAKIFAVDLKKEALRETIEKARGAVETLTRGSARKMKLAAARPSAPMAADCSEEPGAAV